MSGRVSVVGLGPGGWVRVSDEVRALVLDPSRRVFVRTITHPAAGDLAKLRPVEAGDALYQTADTLEEVYERLSDLVVQAAEAGEDVVLALPGSPWVGERTTRLVMSKAARSGLTCRVVSAESFIDAAWSLLGLDPLERGFQVLDGRDLPDPLTVGVPTLIAQVDTPMVLSEVASVLAMTLPEATEVSVIRDLGGPDERIQAMPVDELAAVTPDALTTLFVDAPAHGWAGLVQTMRRLRRECPWDARQTHASLAAHLIEETHELMEAIASLPDDHSLVTGAFVDLEEELGDVLLQVLFQTVIASEEGAFDVEDVVETLRRKLVRRHPHVFGDAQAGTADEVYARWEQIKAEERPPAESVLDGVPAGIPALQRAELVQRRAATVGFDWAEVPPVLAKVAEELEELRGALDDPDRAVQELGDLLFAIVNVARHLETDPELALRRAVGRFEQRFRRMEGHGDLSEMTLDDLEEVWQLVKLDHDAAT